VHPWVIRHGFAHRSQFVQHGIVGFQAPAAISALIDASISGGP